MRITGDHPPRQSDGYQVLKTREADPEPQTREVRPHEAVQKPRVRFAIQRFAVRENGRQARQVAPQPLQVQVQIEVDAEQDQGRDPVEARQGNVGIDDRGGELAARS